MYRNYDSTCSHENYVDDVHTGDTVCQECGKILEENTIFFPQHVHFDPLPDRTITLESMDLILSAAYANHINNDIVQRVIKSVEKTKKQCHIPYDVAVGYAFYLTFIELDVPRTITEVAKMVNVKSAQLWRYIGEEKILQLYYPIYYVVTLLHVYVVH
jgi:transcription initiation factor TFIIIB Brf1 subunit/transcription initiation factor TFIIB